MATKRAASDEVPQSTRANKHLKLDDSNGKDTTIIVQSTNGTNITPSKPQTSPDDPVASVKSHAVAIVHTITALNSELLAEQANSSYLQSTVAGLRAELAEHEKIEQEYGVKYKWDVKLKTLKAEHEQKIQKLREKSQEQREHQEQAWKQKFADLKAKQVTGLAEKEQRWKAKLDEEKAKSKEVLATKMADMAAQVAELKAKHKEQLDKARANVKMVEAARKMVELNAGRQGSGWSSDEAGAVVKVE